MSPPAPKHAIRCLPRRAAAKNGLSCDFRLLPRGGGACTQRLIDMYLGFQPRNCFQGLPPVKDAACVRWVQEMLGTGFNVVADCGPHGMIGHAALFPVNAHKCEMLAVVCPEFQNIGIGTELVRSCLLLAEELGIEKIWLEVSAANLRARHVYRKCGFECASTRHDREIDMICDVCRGRSTLAGAAIPMRPAAVIPSFHFPAVADWASAEFSRR